MCHEVPYAETIFETQRPSAAFSQVLQHYNTARKGAKGTKGTNRKSRKEGKGAELEQELCSQYLSISINVYQYLIPESHFEESLSISPCLKRKLYRTKTFPNLSCRTHPQNCVAFVEYFFMVVSPVLSVSGNSSSDLHAPPEECQCHFEVSLRRDAPVQDSPETSMSK